MVGEIVLNYEEELARECPSQAMTSRGTSTGRVIPARGALQLLDPTAKGYATAERATAERATARERPGSSCRGEKAGFCAMDTGGVWRGVIKDKTTRGWGGRVGSTEYQRCMPPGHRKG